MQIVSFFTSTKRYWRYFFLGVLTLLVILMPVASQMHPAWAKAVEEAPVVLEGRFLFKVRELDNFSAQQRAAQINAVLEQELRSAQPIELEISQEKQLTTIRSVRSDRALVTITDVDLLPGASPWRQALDWKQLIEQEFQQARIERTSAYQRRALWMSIGVLLGTIAFAGLLWLFQFWLSRFLRSWLDTPTSPLYPWEQPAQILLKLAVFGLQAGLWLSIGYYIIDLFPQTRTARYQFLRFINSPIIPLGASRFPIWKILLLVAISVGLWFIVSNLTQIFKTYVLVRTVADQGMQEVLTILVRYLLTFIGVIILLQSWGLDVSSLTILGGALGVGIGLGVQNIANNFISSIIILIERPIQVGDFVKVGDLVGTVARIGSRSTQINTQDRVSIIIPNSRFLEDEVINWSHGDPVSRLRIPVGVAYGSDVNLVKKALLEAAKGHPEVLLRPRPQVWFQEFGDSSLNFDLLVWTGEPKKQPRIKSDLNYRIEASLHRYGLEVPFPQRDLNFRSPQLEKLINVWLQKHSPQEVPTKIQTLKTEKIDTVYTKPEEIDTINEELEVTDTLNEDWLGLDIEEIVTAMRQPGGLEIKDRSFRLKTYHTCFVGSQAVDWMVKRYQCERSEAVELGKMLSERGIIHHVIDEHNFKDDYLFYRFYTDETTRY